jgi:hypothetical protein
MSRTHHHYRPTYFGAGSQNARGSVYRQLPTRYRKNSWQLPYNRYSKPYARSQSLLMPFSGQQFVMFMSLLIVGGWLVDILLFLNRNAIMQLFA